MDHVEFWIWEHASKYEMNQVLKRMKSSYIQINIPNSWLSAAFLCKVKDQWGRSSGDVSSREISSVQEILVGLYRQNHKVLKHTVGVVDFVQLDLGCKAVFLVMRSAVGEQDPWKRARKELFPTWNTTLWNKMKKSYCLKNDTLEDEVRRVYLETRSLLNQPDYKSSVLGMFREKMDLTFPLLISFLRRIKPSTLEKLQASQTLLTHQLSFLRKKLKQGITHESTILDLWEEFQKRRANNLGTKFMTLKLMLRPPKAESSTTATIYGLPPEIRAGRSIALDQLYPQCFESSTYIPSYVSVHKDSNVHEVAVEKTTPIDIHGKAFEPFWFSDGTTPSVKREKLEETENGIKQESAPSPSERAPDRPFSPSTVKENSLAESKKAESATCHQDCVQTPFCPSPVGAVRSLANDGTENGKPSFPAVSALPVEKVRQRRDSATASTSSRIEGTTTDTDTSDSERLTKGSLARSSRVNHRRDVRWKHLNEEASRLALLSTCGSEAPDKYDSSASSELSEVYYSPPRLRSRALERKGLELKDAAQKTSAEKGARTRGSNCPTPKSKPDTPDPSHATKTAHADSVEPNLLGASPVRLHREALCDGQLGVERGIDLGTDLHSQTVLLKRKLPEAKGCPKSKRMLIDKPKDRRALVSSLVETLTEQGNQLRLQDGNAALHAVIVSACAQRVSQSHVKMEADSQQNRSDDDTV